MMRPSPESGTSHSTKRSSASALVVMLFILAAAFVVAVKANAAPVVTYNGPGTATPSCGTPGVSGTGIIDASIGYTATTSNTDPIEILFGSQETDVTVAQGTHMASASFTNVADGTYTVYFNQDSAGTNSVSVKINCAPVPVVKPTVNLTIDKSTITVGDSVVLNWTSKDATSLTASGSWTGSKKVPNGSETVTPSKAGSYTYTLTSNANSAGTGSDSVTLVVKPKVVPTPPKSSTPAPKPTKTKTTAPKPPVVSPTSVYTPPANTNVPGPAEAGDAITPVSHSSSLSMISVIVGVCLLALLGGGSVLFGARRRTGAHKR